MNGRQSFVAIALVLVIAAMVVLWWPGTEPLNMPLRGHSRGVTDVAASATLLASASDDATVRLWSAENGRPTQLLEGHQTSVTALAFHSNGRLLLSGGDSGRIRVWDVSRGIEHDSWHDHSGRVLDIAVDPDSGTIASIAADGSVSVKNAEFEFVFLKRVRGNAVHCIFNAAASSLFLGCSDGWIRQLDVTTQRVTTIAKPHGSKITGLNLTSDGKRIVTCGIDRHICLINPVDGKMKRLKMDVSLFSLCGGSEDCMLVGGNQGRVFCYNAQAGVVEREFNIPLNAVRSLAMSDACGITGGLECSPLRIDIRQFEERKQ